MAKRAAIASRPSRRSARQLPLALATSALLGVGAAWLLLSPEPTAPKRAALTRDVAEIPLPTPASTASQEPAYGGRGTSEIAPLATRAVAAPSLAHHRSPGEPPRSVSEAMALAPTQVDGPTLATWVHDPALEPQIRYAALRRLEQLYPREAVKAAIARLEDPVSLVRSNALAVLARSRDPEARQALDGLDPRRREVAARLAAAGRS